MEPEGIVGGQKKKQVTGGNDSKRTVTSVAFGALAVIAAFVFFWVASTENTLMGFTEGDHLRSGEGHGTVENEGANKICSKVCRKRRKKRQEGVDLSDRSALVQQVEKAKERLLENLKKDYGEYFEPIFVDKEKGGYRPYKPSREVSMDRLKRKLMIKVLSMQSSIDSDFHGCDCSGNKGVAVQIEDVLENLDPANSSLVYEGLEDTDQPGLFEKYVWATGGHSASAGHGNLYNESYTAFMERDLKDVFGSIGIDFVGRNYAMGGTASATIISMCWKEVFGEDVDFFSWDYGMTDGSDGWRAFHYGYRGAITRGRPAMMLMHYGGRRGSSRLNPLVELESIGLPLFIMDDAVESEMKTEFPDSAGISSEEINALPEYVRNYKCGTSIEKGDPFCHTEKFSKWGCTPRSKQTSWHPGWKDHAMDGHGLALFLMEALLDALHELSELEEDTDSLLSRLQKEDLELHNNFTNSEWLPETHKKVADLEEINKQITQYGNESTIDPSIFMQGPSLCHTARVPSETRYKGILMDTDMVGGPAPPGEETYFMGTNIDKAHKKASKDGEMRIVYEEKQFERKCEGVVVKPDHPDSFYANSLDGWTKLKFPNDAEQRFYRYKPDNHQGFIILHLKKCDWGRCPKNFLTIEDYANKDWKMRVNGQRISNIYKLDTFGSIVQASDGKFRFEPDENGQYEIEIKVYKENGYLEFADFVIW